MMNAKIISGWRLLLGCWLLLTGQGMAHPILQNPMWIEVGPDLIGEGEQDAVDFAPFGIFEFAHFVVGVEDLRRFQKHRLARLRLVVDEAFDLAFVLGGNGNHQSPPAHGQVEVVGNPAVLASLPQNRIELFTELCLLRNDLPPNAREFGRSRVADVAPVVDNPVESGQQVLVEGNGAGVGAFSSWLI